MAPAELRDTATRSASKSTGDGTRKSVNTWAFPRAYRLLREHQHLLPPPRLLLLLLLPLPKRLSRLLSILLFRRSLPSELDNSLLCPGTGTWYSFYINKIETT